MPPPMRERRAVPPPTPTQRAVWCSRRVYLVVSRVATAPAHRPRRSSSGRAHPPELVTVAVTVGALACFHGEVRAWSPVGVRSLGGVKPLRMRAALITHVCLGTHVVCADGSHMNKAEGHLGICLSASWVCRVSEAHDPIKPWLCAARRCCCPCILYDPMYICLLEQGMEWDAGC
eukprot:CAMPEP_0183357404 /NCGR_PEP_ID=MMETSP0164_2-20130417/46183_1 /TAXON_ID=221442 /ORGANISM="Coccolithus pelagicus ssp braarudi, Strain PLY182g" /LENGTH=174 /DNA_ID=CAMNT_0025531007 /DNA_START=63 /DNA_END=587 /DNA_ORIENTATION=-